MKSRAEYWERRGLLVRCYLKPEADTSVLCKEFPAETAKDLVAYKGANGALCRFKRQADEQLAFNQVAACFPQVLSSKEWNLIILAAMDLDKSDPLGAHGYIGVTAPAGWEPA